MFQRNKQEHQIDLRMIDTSSKITLKMSCVQAANGDMAKAAELYDFFTKDIELPDYPIPQPTAVQKFTQQAESLFGWIEQNGDKFMKGYNMIQMIRGGNTIPMAQVAETTAANAIPPLAPMN